MVRLASRAYALDKGRRPTALTELVPGYLKSVPQDPVTGTDMLYRP